jgi:hypothetical protein
MGQGFRLWSFMVNKSCCTFLTFCAYHCWDFLMEKRLMILCLFIFSPHICRSQASSHIGQNGWRRVHPALSFEPVKAKVQSPGSHLAAVGVLQPQQWHGARTRQPSNRRRGEDTCLTPNGWSCYSPTTCPFSTLRGSFFWVHPLSFLSTMIILLVFHL